MSRILSYHIYIYICILIYISETDLSRFISYHMTPSHRTYYRTTPRPCDWLILPSVPEVYNASRDSAKAFCASVGCPVFVSMHHYVFERPRVKDNAHALGSLHILNRSMRVEESNDMIRPYKHRDYLQHSPSLYGTSPPNSALFF